MSGDFSFADGLSMIFCHRPSDHSDIDDFGGIVDDPVLSSPFMNFSDYLHSSVDYGQLTDASSTDRALFSASGGGGKISGTTPVTRNSSLSWSSTEAAAGEEDSEKCKKEVEEKQLAEEKEEDRVDKSKKVLIHNRNSKARKKGEKRQKEPRFAFMTKSDVDHLEDGYRWRKYGQKAVKNSPYPRSYYRCTTQKCMVKKRVERSFKNPSIVITTYEGQHTHQIPATTRGSTHALPPPQAMPPSFGPRLDLLMQQYVLNPNIYMPSTLQHQQQQQQQQQRLQFPDHGLLQDIVLSSNPNQP